MSNALSQLSTARVASQGCYSIRVTAQVLAHLELSSAMEVASLVPSPVSIAPVQRAATSALEGTSSITK